LVLESGTYIHMHMSPSEVDVAFVGVVWRNLELIF
jgi:hypothetical protein